MLGYFSLLFGVLGCIFCPFWIKKAKDSRDRGYGIFSMFGACLILFCGLFIVSYENDILFFALKQENINAKIDIDPALVEPSSVLYLFNDNITHQTTSLDIEELLGEPYEESTSAGSYYMTYQVTNYTLNGRPCNFLSVHFNKSGEKGKIRSIRWQYALPSTKIYGELLDYLTLLLGTPTREAVSDLGTLTADWPGYHLECNDYRVSFGREFN